MPRKRPSVSHDDHRDDLIAWAESCLPVERKDFDSEDEWQAWKAEHPHPLTSVPIEAWLLSALAHKVLGPDAVLSRSRGRMIELPVFHLKNFLAMVKRLPTRGQRGPRGHTYDQLYERDVREL